MRACNSLQEKQARIFFGSNEQTNEQAIITNRPDVIIILWNYFSCCDFCTNVAH